MTDRYSAPSHFMPYPELLAETPDPYEIVDSTAVRGLPTDGMVDQVRRLMLVPLDASGLVVGRHECAHVLWSPERMPRQRGYAGYLLAVEDGRINSGLRRIGLGIDLDAEQLDRIVELGREDLRHGELGLVYWALRSIASHGTSAWHPLLALVDEMAPLAPGAAPALPLFPAQRARDLVVRAQRKLDEARARAGGPVADFERGVLVSRWLRRGLCALGLPEPPEDRRFVCCLAAGLALGGGGRRRHGDPAPGSGGGGTGGPGPGRMRIAEPALPHACAPPRRGRAPGRRHAAEGTELRDISRFAHDRKVFSVRARCRRGGGSVLIDQSGSMCLEASDIDRLIADAPEATLVANYSGRGAEGELRVVVRDGRRAAVEDLAPFGSGNVVDLPALEWLARQPAPRVLVSDGGFTGIDDQPSRVVRSGCRRLMRNHRIVRVESAAAAAAELSARR